MTDQNQMMPLPAGLAMGIDAGGTHTRARLVDASGTVIGTGEAGPANTRIGLPDSIAVVSAAAAAAVRDAGLAPSDSYHIEVGLGIAGLNRRGVVAGLRAYPFPFARLALASDAAIACAGAHSGRDGAIVIIGTGSIGFGRVGEKTIVVGGYGFPISDEGSGADMGLQAVKRSLWSRDGRMAPTPLTRDLLDRFAGSASRLVAWMDKATATDYAALAPLVVEHAERGDAVGEPIIREAAAGVDRMVRTLLRKGAPACCLMGGLAPRIVPWLPPVTRARLTEPEGDALSGAIYYARTRGLPPGEALPK